ncbi:MAG: hypothetical protein FJZ01_26840 [Candidatus Sericytochromatia bacterium]|nr:hypothetical protein [Candidatus Tanganyikabacteria bacterium]
MADGPSTGTPDHREVLPVRVGGLADPEVFKIRALDVICAEIEELEQQIEPLQRKLGVLAAKREFYYRDLLDEVLGRLGVQHNAQIAFTEDNQVVMDRRDAERAGLPYCPA